LRGFPQREIRGEGREAEERELVPSLGFRDQVTVGKLSKLCRVVRVREHEVQAREEVGLASRVDAEACEDGGVNVRGVLRRDGVGEF
jgi:hypothetical protein